MANERECVCGRPVSACVGETPQCPSRKLDLTPLEAELLEALRVVDSGVLLMSRGRRLYCTLNPIKNCGRCPECRVR